MIKITIDDQQVEVDQGKTILDAAKLAGREIPTLCHHPAVRPAGACRICVVEIVAGGRPGLVPACAYPAMDEMEIPQSANTPEIFDNTPGASRVKKRK